MLARIQRFLFALAIAWALGWAWLCVQSDRTAWAWAGLPVLLTGYAGLLALEFLLMRQMNRRHGVAPAWGDLLRAWWGEVLCGPRVFGWRQPWRSACHADRLEPARPGARGVVLIHGYFCNRGLWNPWVEALDAERVPWVAVNLEPVFGDIDDYLPLVEAAVQRLERTTGQAPVLVGHSMGGIVLRRWCVEPGRAGRVHHAITLGSPHHGAWLARWALSRNARQMRIGSRWLQRLSAAEAGRPRVPTTCYYTACDNIVFPADSARLEGADNRLLSSVAHVDMVHRPEPLQRLREVLAD